MIADVHMEEDYACSESMMRNFSTKPILRLQGVMIDDKKKKLECKKEYNRWAV